MNYNKLKALAKEKKIPIKRLIEENTDMKEAGFHAAIKNNSLTVRVLEDIAKALEVPVGYFFNDYSKDLMLPERDDVKNLQSEIIRLQRELIEEKERNIRLMEKIQNSQ